MGINTEDFDYLKEEKSEERRLEKDVKKEEKKETSSEFVKEDSFENTEKTTESQIQDSFIFIVKVSAGKEGKTLELIADRVNSKNLEVYSIIRAHGLKGYVIIEAKDKENAEEACYNLPYVKNILPKNISYEEIRNLVEPTTKETNIEKNDIVEIIGEPFKKEQAKVIRVDNLKGEVVVSLLNAVIPLPVTVKIDDVRVIRREEEKS